MAQGKSAKRVFWKEVSIFILRYSARSTERVLWMQKKELKCTEPPKILSEKLSSGLLVCPTQRNLNSIAYHEEGTRVKPSPRRIAGHKEGTRVKPSPRLTYLFCCKTNVGKQKLFKTQLIMYQEMEGKKKEPIKEFVTIDQKGFLIKTESRYCCLDQEGMLVYDLANKITLLLCSYMYVVVCLASPRI